MKKLLAVAALVSLFAVSCSTQQPTSPLVHRDGAQGTPVEGDGGGDGGGGSQPASISAALSPASQIVAAGADIFVNIDVTANYWPGWDSDDDGIPDLPGGFNVWEAYLSFDQSKLDYIAGQDSERQGCLMTGACAGSNGVHACGSTYTIVAVSPDYYIGVQLPANKMAVGDALLCYQTMVNGPGRVFTLHFRAKAGQHGTVAIGIDSIGFSQAGQAIYASPATGATVTIN